MVAGKLATLGPGRPDNSANLPVIPRQAEAAALLNVGERTVRLARTVLDRGAPELQQAVERGKVSVTAAADIATLPAR
jgi:hypothetical protein